MTIDDRIHQAYRKVREDLWAARSAAGHWEGRLASSALSTATAISALSIARSDSAGTNETLATPPEQTKQLVQDGVNWLVPQQNQDGGWGDTDKSHSNIATTMLVIAALHLAGVVDQHAESVHRAQEYVDREGGIVGLRRRYGKDKTFAVPILTNCALAGLVPWSDVSPLPFEMACLPQSWYRLVRLPVVSYAIPALVAVGQVRHAMLRPRNPLTRWLRDISIHRSLRVLRQMQPASGGYLEAIPLTSFVVMSLVGAGQGDYVVVREGLRFLVEGVRDDGSWPIDTNLATWNTTLAVNSLAAIEELHDVPCWDWILSCQQTQRHPFTGAEPGGWGWSDLSGAVPDADDTPGALLALRRRFDACPEGGPERARIAQAACAGVGWLLGLQNRDGGWPTFCRGWGTLPFDRSGTDLTAHALRALHTWNDQTAQDVGRPVERGFAYLTKTQRDEGSWYPLWFGNQDHPDEENPVYGTARVLLAYRDLGRLQDGAARRGLAWLRAQQQGDGGWNAGRGSRQDVDTPRDSALSIVEETALAVEALLADNEEASVEAARRGLQWLVEAVQQRRHLRPTPIGFYFAKLWYYEQLYPIVFTLSALSYAARHPIQPCKSEVENPGS